MRKRKANPSLEVVVGLKAISLSLEKHTTSEVQEVTVGGSQPTGPQDATRIPVTGELTPEVDVEVGGSLSPPRIEGVVTNLGPATVAEVDTTVEPELPYQERVLANRFREEEADVAGENTAELHWF